VIRAASSGGRTSSPTCLEGHTAEDPAA
jgi:hypothetical protein